MNELAVETEFALTARSLGHYDDPIPHFDTAGLRHFDDFASRLVAEIGGLSAGDVNLELGTHGGCMDFDDNPVFAGGRVGGIDYAALIGSEYSSCLHCSFPFLVACDSGYSFLAKSLVSQ